MDYAEEQRNELEMLESIYGGDLKVASKTTFSLKLEPSSSGTTKNFVGATLHVTFTASYPDEVAQLRVSADKGLLPDQVADLQRLVDSTAQENVGMASVFTIAEAVKEWLLANNVDCGDGSMFAEMMASLKRAEKQEAARAAPAVTVLKDDEDEDDEDQKIIRAAMNAEIERERKRVLGTPVTPETFLAWRVKFEAEMAATRVRTYEDEVAGKPSGREQFEMGGAAFLAAAEATDRTPMADEEEDAAAASSAVVLADVPIDASIFLDDAGLSDDDDEEWVDDDEDDEDDEDEDDDDEE